MAYRVFVFVSLTRHSKTLEHIVSAFPRHTRRILMRGCGSGAWLSVLPSTVNGTELSAQEFRDPSHCDGCGLKFSVSHALDCPNGGLIIARYNEVRDELCNLWARGTDCILDIRVTDTDALATVPKTPRRS